MHAHTSNPLDGIPGRLAEIDQNKALTKPIPVILGVNIPLIAALAWIYWPWVNHGLLVLWCTVMVLILGARFGLYYFVYKKIPQNNLRRWHMKFFSLNSAISGVMWGLAGVLFFVADKLELQLILFLVLVLKGIGSVSSVTSYLPAFYAYFPASMLPLCTMFLINGGMVSVLLGVTGLIFTLVLLVFANNLNRIIVDSLKLRYENQQLLEQTLQQKHQADQSNHAKSRFLAAASHDLRQPIHALNLFNSALEETVKDTKSKKIVLQTRNTIDSLQNLLDALLDISKLDAGAVQANKEHFDTQVLVSKLRNDLSGQALKKRLQMEWPSENHVLYTDPSLLEQVLRNLIANAIANTTEGHIAVHARLMGQHIRIEVTDTGAGIAPELHKDIFSEFYQIGNKQRDRRQGLGLGLAIVERVIKLLGSQVMLESTPGVGSCFYFDLPCADPEQVSSNKTKTDTSAARQHYDTSGAVIGVIEDDVEVALALQVLLDNWGCTMILATEASDIINQLEQEGLHLDAIISDYQLSDHQNGIDAIKVIRTHIGKTIPAIVVTGNIADDCAAHARESNIPLLHKPVPPSRLRAFIQNSII